ncbi:MAG TPA: LCP family protein [Amycolatopsis sp.]|nr:LCP family protein [Amycolatopsis sp.]
MSASRSARIVGRTTIALVSLLVLGGTGLGWAQEQGLVNGLSRADVLDPGASTTTGEQNILVVGLDTRTDAQGNPLPRDILDALHAGASDDGGDNTDTMVVIHIPAGGGDAVAFSIPRDSYVQLAGGYGKHKINSAYTYAQVAEENTLRSHGVSGPQLNVRAAQAGARNAVQTVEQLTGLTINHFASVNLVGFYDISEAVGGIPVCLKAAVRDPYSGANFPAGAQTISGAQALAFVRQRHGLPDGDLDRIRRQQAFMASMAHTVLSAGTLTNPGKLSALVGAVHKSVTLDQDWDILSFAQQLRNLGAGAIRFQTIPVGTLDLQTSDGDAVQVDPAQVRSFIRGAIGEPSTVAPVTAGPATHPDAVVEVDNATGVTGVATRVAQDLTDHGYSTGSTADVPSRRTTVVDYGPGERAAAEDVARLLGNDIAVVSDPELGAGRVRVYLGTGYPGPASTSATPTTAPAPAITASGQNCVD